MKLEQRRLLVISLHGGAWTTFAPFIDQGAMPVLQSLRDDSASGDLRSVLPTFPPPNWASFWTGENPGKHGVYAYAVLRPDGTLGPRATTDEITSPTWLDAITRAGLQTVSMMVPLTQPVPAVDGVCAEF